MPWAAISAGVNVASKISGGKKSSKAKKKAERNAAWQNYLAAESMYGIGMSVIGKQAGALEGAASEQAGLLEWGAAERFGLQGQNMDAFKTEYREEARRMAADFGRTESTQRAFTAASGIEMTGTAADYLDETAAEHSRQLTFFNRQAQRTLGVMERERQMQLDYARQEAASLRSIAAMEAEAMRYSARMEGLGNIFRTGLQYQAAGGDLPGNFWKPFKGTPYIQAARNMYIQAGGSSSAWGA